MKLKTIKPVRRCADCGHLIPQHRRVCPYCTGDTKTLYIPPVEGYTHVSEEDVTLVSPSKFTRPDIHLSRKFLWVALGGIIALAIAALLFFVIPWGGKKDNNMTEDVSDIDEEKYENKVDVKERKDKDNSKFYADKPFEEGWTGSHQLKGVFYKGNKSWPVSLKLTIQEDGTIDGASYNNISQHVTINSMYGYYNADDGSLNLRDRNENLVLELSRNASGKISGVATSGSTSLNVNLSEEGKSEEYSPAPVEITNYYNYQGTITYKSDAYYFQMNLEITGTRVKGDYIVTNGDNVRVSLSGTVDNNGNALIKEYKNGRYTGYYFQGYLSVSSFSGKYNASSRRLSMDFYASSY